jgi:hypothetical protein
MPIVLPRTPARKPLPCRMHRLSSKNAAAQSVPQVASQDCRVRHRSQARLPRLARCPAHPFASREIRCNSIRAALAKSSNPADTSFRGLHFGPQQIESAHADCQHYHHTCQFDAENPVPAFCGGRVLKTKSTSPFPVFIHQPRQTKSRRADRRQQQTPTDSVSNGPGVWTVLRCH